MVSAQAITDDILLGVELAGYCQLLGKENLLVVLHNVPVGKRLGICQTADQAVRGETGLVADLEADCIAGCAANSCLMFGLTLEENGRLHRNFTCHDPEY